MHRVVVRLAVDTVLVAIVLFLSAGTIAWRHAWLLLVVMSLVRGAGALAVHRVNASLLRERASLPIHEEQPWADRLLLFAVLATGFLGLPIIAGLDAFRWHLFARPTAPFQLLGLVLFALGWILKSLALHANAFAVAVVRLQHDRAHEVVDSGPYRIIRHPFYAADPLIFVGLSLWLESYAAVLWAAFPTALMVMRLQLEERFLGRALPGYPAYVERVRFRLVPGVW